MLRARNKCARFRAPWLVTLIGTCLPALADAGASAVESQDGGWLSNWFERSERARSEQPHWVTPVVTVTPRLEQELRYDQIWQTSPAGKTLWSYGGGKGVELIPFDPVEVIIGIPAWQDYNHGQHGWGDENLLFKLRLASANEESGNYIVTGFLGFTLPWGSAHTTGGHVVTTPTIAAGKGWGDFAVQSTFGVSIPDYGAASWGSGTPLLWNTALQYHVAWKLWPELEFNYTYWPDGQREGRSQLYITPGVVLGRLHVWRTAGFTVGLGYQTAVTSRPNNDHALILTARLPF
jgi:hypothetical protein